MVCLILYRNIYYKSIFLFFQSYDTGNIIHIEFWSFNSSGDFFNFIEQYKKEEKLKMAKSNGLVAGCVPPRLS